MKKRYLILLIFFIVSGCSTEQKTKSYFIENYSYLEKENGWISELIVSRSYTNDNLDKTEYFFNGVNMKYKELEGYYIPIIDGKGDEVGQGNVTIPLLLYNKDSRNEIELLNKYFNEKQFEGPITEDDISDIKLRCLNSKEIVNLYNNAIIDEFAKKEFGPYILKESDCIQKELKDGSILQVSFVSIYGFIRVVNIEYILPGTIFLSDIVKTDSINVKQLTAQNYLDELEKDIVKKQKVELVNIISPIDDEELYKEALQSLLKEAFLL